MDKFIAAVTFAALLLGSLGVSAQGRQVTDASGNQVEVPLQPTRIVALSELDLDVLLALGETPIGTVNGRGQAGLPGYLAERAPQIRIIGDIGNVNTELLLELQPDLILTGPERPETLSLYNAIAPTVVSYTPGEPWQQTLQLTAEILGKPQAADDFNARYQAALASARQRLAAQQGQSLSIVRWNPKGPVYMLKDAFASQVVQQLGFVRPLAQQQAGFTHSQALSLESLDLLDADWLVVGTLASTGEAADALRQARSTPAFTELGAVQAGQMTAVDGSLWTSIGGPLAALQVAENVVEMVEARR